MRKISLLSLVLALALVLGMALPALASDLSGYAGKLVILHTNDVHGRAVFNPASGVFGYAAVAELKWELEEAGASVLLLDAGDASQGTPIVNLSQGAAAMEFMNAVGYDAMTPGNHEFDWGYDNVLKLKELARFPMLAANIIDRASGETAFEPHIIFEAKNGVKVGVFGLGTPETLTKTHPDKVRGANFLMGDELYACAQAQIDQLNAAGCDLIVCLGHLGVADESAPNRSYDVIEKTTGIDLFIDGHSHTVIDGGEKVGDTLLVSTGEYFGSIGMVTYDGEALTALLVSAAVDKDAYALGLIEYDLDDEISALVDGVDKAVYEQLSVPFAKTEVLLNGERAPGVRTEETNLGDFAADAILWAAKVAVGDDVAAAVTNGGGIRTSIQPGDISMLDMKTVFPFGNQVTVLTVTGAELLGARGRDAHDAGRDRRVPAGRGHPVHNRHDRPLRAGRAVPEFHVLRPVKARLPRDDRDGRRPAVRPGGALQDRDERLHRGRRRHLLRVPLRERHDRLHDRRRARGRARQLRADAARRRRDRGDVRRAAGQDHDQVTHPDRRQGWQNRLFNRNRRHVRRFRAFSGS